MNYDFKTHQKEYGSNNLMYLKLDLLSYENVNYDKVDEKYSCLPEFLIVNQKLQLIDKIHNKVLLEDVQQVLSWRSSLLNTSLSYYIICTSNSTLKLAVNNRTTIFMDAA